MNITVFSITAHRCIYDYVSYILCVGMLSLGYQWIRILLRRKPIGMDTDRAPWGPFFSTVLATNARNAGHSVFGEPLIRPKLFGLFQGVYCYLSTDPDISRKL